MFRKRLVDSKRLDELISRIEDAEEKIATLRVQYILIKYDRNRIKELLDEKNESA
ncbi:hypothetical protein UFOVP573_74 [uncultured Caudovirales phage]|uniref:Uncharacterized protein n=1 Tax=uncultured Caudovirales phage TaxID=2100421 RepID=A0A6J5PWI5_9CAUD|nr:hypothetical protein UFOVP288_41 [uncultured Caudovirales phage]CAB4146193.1 hypothetical protein UFOVP483_155 [uncultured Caudovirales phage]CAB4150943.1 hypothetical protein UFOVP573_74 [uncultured Caudovirales phage]CAB4161246.1 hypothetical protein UFOVP769_41 [uncultured Caudovirales phage]CAB4173781.1 hypothetical protein UFOVP962_9 [uncultured Caudovirales phage]